MKKTFELAMNQTDYNATIRFMMKNPHTKTTHKQAQTELDELIAEAASGKRRCIKGRGTRQYFNICGTGGVEVEILWYSRKSPDGYINFKLIPTWNEDPTGEPVNWPPKAA